MMPISVNLEREEILNGRQSIFDCHRLFRSSDWGRAEQLYEEHVFYVLLPVTVYEELLEGRDELTGLRVEYMIRCF